MQRIELELKPRDLGDTQKRNLTQLRAEGWVPGVLYGNGDPIKVAVDVKSFRSATHTKAGINALFTLKIGGESALGVIKEVQRHIIKHNPIHVDFQRINLKQKLEISVPTHPVGESTGVKNSGGILEHMTREIRIRCLPDDIPASIDIDVSQLEVGHAIKVKDLPEIKGVEILTLKETIIVNVILPKVEEEKPVAGAAAGAAGSEPEVIAKGKKPEEGAEGAAPAAGAAKGAAAPAGAAAAKGAPAKGKEEKKK